MARKLTNRTSSGNGTMPVGHTTGDRGIKAQDKPRGNKKQTLEGLPRTNAKGQRAHSGWDAKVNPNATIGRNPVGSKGKSTGKASSKTATMKRKKK